MDITETLGTLSTQDTEWWQTKHTRHRMMTNKAHKTQNDDKQNTQDTEWWQTKHTRHRMMTNKTQKHNTKT